MENISSEDCYEGPSVSELNLRECGLPRHANSLILRRTIEERRLRRPKVILPIPHGNALPICMNIDSIENSFLLCGKANGDFTVVNLAFDNPTSADPHVRSSSMVNACQWFTDDLGIFVSAGQDNYVRMADVNKSSDIHKFKAMRPTHVHWNEVNKHNPLVAICENISIARLLDFRCSNLVAQDLRHSTNVSAVRWEPSSKNLLFTTSNDRNLSIWDIRRSKRALHNINISDLPDVQSIRFTPDGLWVVLCSRRPFRLQVFSTVTLKPFVYIELESDGVHPFAARNMTVCCDGTALRIAVPSDNDEIYWITVYTNQSRPSYYITRLNGHLSKVTACEYRHSVQELYTSAKFNILKWSSEGERARQQMVSETTRNMVVDSWSDEDD